MSCFLQLDENDTAMKINIDELYEKKKLKDLKQLSIYNKILNRIHKRIMTTSKMKSNDRHIWFTIPEYIFGEPIYDKGDCTGYLVSKLEENGFYIRYTHPNNLFVSWHNWIPTYTRNEIKKKTGIVIDEKGNIIEDEEKKDDNTGENIYKDKNGNIIKTGKKYTPINQYKPTGNLVYNPELFEKIEERIDNDDKKKII